MHAGLALCKRAPSPPPGCFCSEITAIAPTSVRHPAPTIGASWSDMNANIMAILLLQKW